MLEKHNIVTKKVEKKENKEEEDKEDSDYSEDEEINENNQYDFLNSDGFIFLIRIFFYKIF